MMVIKQYCVKNKKYHLNKLLLNWKKMFYFIYKMLRCMCLLRTYKCSRDADLTWGHYVFYPAMGGFSHVSKVRLLMNLSFSIISFMLKKKTAPDDISTQSGVHRYSVSLQESSDRSPTRTSNSRDTWYVTLFFFSYFHNPSLQASSNHSSALIKSKVQEEKPNWDITWEGQTDFLKTFLVIIVIS